jgi:hypothetical protein
MQHRQLQHAHALAFAEQRDQHMASVGKFDRVMVLVRNVRIDRAELSDPEIDFARPDPAVVVSDVLGERQFSAGKHADRDGGLAFGGEAARRGAAEGRGDQRLSDFGGARRHSVQTIVTHWIAPRSFEMANPRRQEAQASIDGQKLVKVRPLGGKCAARPERARSQIRFLRWRLIASIVGTRADGAWPRGLRSSEPA